MVKYDLHLLGWHAFQQLCLTVVREILGQTVASFLDTNDAGKDGAFSGVWEQSGGEDLHGNFVIQCKFTNRSDHKLQLSDLADEFDKIKKLVAAGRCESYILMTNAGVSGRFEGAFNKKMAALGVRAWRIFGSTWICTQIYENKRLRMLVPRIYGLGDLSQILDERAYAQARQLLISMRDDLSKIVITSAYYKAAKALNDHGFVLIIGEAAAGKTTIASLLAMAAVDQWQAYTLKLDRPEQVTKHWNPEDPNQFIWIDDAFGVTQYESSLVTNWNHVLVQVRTMLKQGIKIVMTSRDYIYARARYDLKDGAFPLFNESQVVIDLHKLTLAEKEQILYNHLKLGRQSKEYISEIKPYLDDIAAHQRFIPETARRLADPAFTKNLYLGKHSLVNFVDKQESFLIDVMKGLDKDSKAALALIYMNNGQLDSPVELNGNETAAIERLGSDAGRCIDALSNMKDSFVQFTYIDDNAIWRYKHPTIGDAYAKIVAQSPEQLQIYLQGTEVSKLLEQVTCGDVQIEKAVIVPKSMFPIMLKHLQDFKLSEAFKSPHLTLWDAKRKVLTFLARRSSKEFLKLYIDHQPELFELITKPSMAFYFSNEIKLVIRLHEVKLLPEEYRKSFIEYISQYAITGDDLEVLNNEKLQQVFTPEELASVKSQIREILIGQLARVRENRQKEFRQYNSDSSDEHMEDFFEKMNLLLEEYEDNEKIVELVEEEVRLAKEWVNEHNFYDRTERAERILDSMDEATTITTTRSIFDDVDN